MCTTCSSLFVNLSEQFCGGKSRFHMLYELGRTLSAIYNYKLIVEVVHNQVHNQADLLINSYYPHEFLCLFVCVLALAMSSSRLTPSTLASFSSRE